MPESIGLKVGTLYALDTWENHTLRVLHSINSYNDHLYVMPDFSWRTVQVLYLGIYLEAKDLPTFMFWDLSQNRRLYALSQHSIIHSLTYVCHAQEP